MVPPHVPLALLVTRPLPLVVMFEHVVEPGDRLTVDKVVTKLPADVVMSPVKAGKFAAERNPDRAEVGILVQVLLEQLIVLFVSVVVLVARYDAI